MLADVLCGMTYMKPSEVSKLAVKTIPKEEFFIRFGEYDIKTCRYIITEGNGYVQERITQNFIDTPDEPQYSGFTSFKCIKMLDSPRFLKVYKFVSHKDEYQALYKWIKDGHAYYVGRKIVLDETGRLLLSIDYTNNSVNMLTVNKNIVLKSDYMSKYIYNTFIPAFIKAFDHNIVFRSTYVDTPSYYNKYLSSSCLRDELNKKLHFIAKHSEF